MKSSLLMLFGLLFLSLAAQANYSNVEQYSVVYSSSDIKAGKILSVEDARYAQMKTNTSWQSEFWNASVKDYITLSFEDEKLKKYGDFTFKVHFKVKSFNEQGTLLSISAAQVLEVGYTDGSGSDKTYKDKSVYTTTGAYRMEVEILSIENPNNLTLDEDIVLEEKVEVERYYFFDSYAVSGQEAFFRDNNNLDVVWNMQKGAVYYELQYVFVSKFITIPGATYGDQTSQMLAALNWRNATRIITANNSFTMPLITEEGRLYFRIRGVGRTVKNSIAWIEGNWSGTGTIQTTISFEAARNWSYVAAFGIDGQRSDQLTFSDGTGRVRQSVVNNQEEDLAVVGESFYDYDGMATLQALPGIVPNGALKFYSGFTVDASGNNYDKDNFATDAKIMNADPLGSFKNDVAGGKYYNNYFTENNPELHKGTNEYLDGADNYGFSQSIFDARGRLRKQSSVGNAHKMASGHYHEIFYGTPAQAQLDRLFGNDAGHKEYYSMSIAKDENGQKRITYYDLTGQIIAEGVAGYVPQENGVNMLDQLPTYKTTQLTSSIIGGNAYSASANAISLTTSYTPTEPGNHDFTYTLDGALFDALCLNDDTKQSSNGGHYTCKYLIDITIKRSEEEEVYHYTTPVSSNDKTVSFSVNFPVIDVYVIEKKLMLDENEVATAVAAYSAFLETTAGAACLTPIETRIPLIAADVDAEGTCESCQETMKNKAWVEWQCYQITPTNCADFHSDLAHATFSEYANARIAQGCSGNVDETSCEDFKEMLGEDLSPGGQYFENTAGLGDGTWSWWLKTDTYTYDGQTYHGLGKATEEQIKSINFYAYKDDGTLDDVKHNFTTWDDVKAKWQDGFQEALVSGHPEYCGYNWCNIVAPFEETNLILSELSLQQAMNLNYVGIDNDGKLIVSNTIVTNDKIVTDGGTTFPYFGTHMIGELAEYHGLVDGLSVEYYTSIDQITMMQVAEYLAKNGITNASVSDEEIWASFIGLYLNEKQHYINTLKDAYYTASGCKIPMVEGDVTDVPDDITSGNHSKDEGFSWGNGFKIRLLNHYDFNEAIGVKLPPRGIDLTQMNIQNDNIKGRAEELKNMVCDYPAGACYDLKYYWLNNEPLIKNGEQPVPLSIQVQRYCGYPYPKYTIVNAFVFQGGVNSTYGDFLISLQSYIENHPVTLFNASVDFSLGKICVERNASTPQPETSGCMADLTLVVEFEDLVFNNDGINDVNRLLYNRTRSFQDCYKYAQENCFCEEGKELYGAYLAQELEADPTLLNNPDLNDLVYQDIANYYNTKYPTLTNDNLVSSSVILLPDGTTDFVYESVERGDLTAAEVKNMLTNCFRYGNPLDVTYGNLNFWELYETGRRDFLAPVPNELLSCDDPCEQWKNDYVYTEAQTQYDNDKKKLLEEFERNYRERCFSQLAIDQGWVKETFTMTFTTVEYQYTLYYYDQADNLIKTIAPAGIDILDDAELVLVENHRKNLANSPAKYPDHRMPNTFEYNTLGNILKTESPDQGTTTLIYDELGRLLLSQNAKQAANSIPAAKKYGYIVYDGLSRPVEAGELTTASTLISTPIAKDLAAYKTWLNSGTRNEVTVTVYDEAISSADVDNQFLAYGGQINSCNRVASVLSYDTYSASTPLSDYKTAMHFSYNVHGVVNKYVNDNKDPFKGIAQGGISHQRFKHVDYQFSLLAGQLESVTYQIGKEDQMIHRFDYDISGRLKRVYTSRDNVIWDLDAKYVYYRHGPLARVELGDKQVQGVDFAYNILGWLKGINSATLNSKRDIGQDGRNGGKALSDKKGSNSTFARDAYGFTLSYFRGDYDALSRDVTDDINFDAQVGTGSALDATWGNLYNGSITKMTSAIYLPTAGGNGVDLSASPQTTAYRYDQLYQLKEVVAFRDHTSNFINNNVYTGFFAGGGKIKIQSDYYEHFDYDPNGNILKLKRNGYNAHASGIQMDELNYFYDWSNPGETDINKRQLINTNRLHHVSDAVASGYSDDIDNTVDGSNGGADSYNLDYKGQTKTGNKRQDGGVDDYEYDELGSVVRNRNEEIKEIQWTFARKVKKITRFNWSAKPDVEFVYDALGRRVGKVVKPKNATTKAVLPMDQWAVTYYALDASGKQFATYDLKFNNTSQQLQTVTLNEHHLYGASRLGIATRNETQTGATMLFAGIKSRTLGKKSFELPNHLGSVMTVISDRKIAGEEYTEHTFYGSGFDGGDYDMFRKINIEQNKVVEFQDFEDGHLDGIVSNTSTLSIGGIAFGDSEKRLIVTTAAKFAGVGKIFELEKGKAYNLSFNYQRNSNVDGWVEFRDAITGNLLGLSQQMVFGVYPNAPNNNIPFVATTSMLYVKFFRGNDYNVATNNGEQKLYIDKIKLETTEKASVSYEEMVVTNPNNNTNALLLSNSNHKYGPEMYIPVKPGATLISAGIKALKDPNDSKQIGGVLVSDFQLENNTPVYEKVGNSYVSLFRASANAQGLIWGDYIVTDLPTLPAQVYDVNGKPYDMGKTQFYLRVMPVIPDGNFAATYFDDLVVELSESNTGTKVFYTADIQQNSDYYAFGSPQAGRTYGSGYKFGYQGSEKDNEVSGDGNSYTTEFRQLDPRLGRWFSVDPVFQPWQSPYTSMDNNPICLNDPMGDKAGPEVIDRKNDGPSWLRRTWNKMTGNSYKNVAYKWAQDNGYSYKDVKFNKNKTTGQHYAYLKLKDKNGDGVIDITVKRFWDGGVQEKAVTMKEAKDIDYSEAESSAKFKDDWNYIKNGSDGTMASRYWKQLKRDWNRTSEEDKDAVIEANTAGIGGIFTLFTRIKKGTQGGKLLTQFSTKTVDDAVALVMKDPNKIAHIFAAKHKLDPLVNALGGQENTIRAVLNAANGKLPSAGTFKDIAVTVEGVTVLIRGAVVNGIPRIGTMFVQ